MAESARLHAVFVVEDSDPATGSAHAADVLFGSEISWTVLSVIAEHPRNTTGQTGFAGPVLTDEQMDRIASEARVEGDGAAAATARAIGDRPIAQRVERGSVVAAVQRCRTNAAVDLIVTASPDVADRLAEAGELPVLVMPDEGLSDIGGPVLVAVDGSDLDEQILSTTARLFAGSAYAVVHVGSDVPWSPAAHSAVGRGAPIPLRPNGVGGTSVSNAGDLETALDSAEQVAARASDDAGIDSVVPVGGVGDPVSEILAAADAHHASVIALGTHDRGWLSHLVRPSVADAVLDRSHRPVIVMASSS